MTLSARRLLAGFLLTASLACAQSTITYNFGTSSGSLAASSGAVSNLTISSVSSFTGQTLTNASSSVSSGYSGASGQFNASFAAVSGSFSSSTSSAFVVTLTPASGYQVTVTNVTFGSRSTASGPTALTVRTSADSFGTNTYSTSTPSDSSWNLYNTGTLTSITGSNSSPLTLRIYGSGGSSAAAGNWRIDDLQITVTMTAVPEPSSYAGIAGMAVLGAAVYRRQRRKKLAPVSEAVAPH